MLYIYLNNLESQKELDIGFLIGATRLENFEKAKEVTKRMISKYYVNNDKTRIAVVQYSLRPSLIKALDASVTKFSLTKLIDDLLHKRDGLDLSNAVQYAKSNIFVGCSSSSPCKDQSKVLAIFTDRKPDQATKEIVAELSKIGVEIKFVFLSNEDLDPTGLGFDDGDRNIDVEVVKATDDLNDIDLAGVVDKGRTALFSFSVNDYFLTKV